MSLNACGVAASTYVGQQQVQDGWCEGPDHATLPHLEQPQNSPGAAAHVCNVGLSFSLSSCPDLHLMFLDMSSVTLELQWPTWLRTQLQAENVLQGLLASAIQTLSYQSFPVGNVLPFRGWLQSTSWQCQQSPLSLSVAFVFEVSSASLSSFQIQSEQNRCSSICSALQRPWSIHLERHKHPCSHHGAHLKISQGV